MNDFGRGQRDYIKFRESDSRDDRSTGRFRGLNRFGRDFVGHDHFQDDQFNSNDDPTYEDENGMRHPYEHGGKENHQGKGPKGYRRSDEKMKDDACEVLMRDYELDASEIEVEVEDGILFLTGEVSSRKDKKRAESLVENLTGITDVQNKLIVKKSEVQGWIPGLGKVSQEGDDHGKV